MDLEALEAENDRGIAALGDRVGALRGITTGIHGEVESQHRLLDNMVRKVVSAARTAGGVALWPPCARCLLPGAQVARQLLLR